MNMTNW